MKKRLLILLLCLSGCSFNANAQSSFRPYSSKFQWEMFGIGINAPITRFVPQRDNMSDWVFSYGDDFSYVQLFGASYFFDKHWGITGKIQLGFKNDYDADAFFYNLYDQYAYNYYFTIFNIEDHRPAVFGRLYLGFIYRIEYGRFFVHPKLLVGANLLGQGGMKAELKEMNSNNVIDIKYGDYRESLKSDSRLIFSPAVSFGIKASKRLHINLEIAGSYFRSGNYRVEYSVTDRSSGNVLDSQLTQYRAKNIFGITFGCGISLVF